MLVAGYQRAPLRAVAARPYREIVADAIVVVRERREGGWRAKADAIYLASLVNAAVMDPKQLETEARALDAAIRGPVAEDDPAMRQLMAAWRGEAEG